MSTRMSRVFGWIAVVGLVLGLTGASSAGVILIDFENQAPDPPQVAPSYWNVLGTSAAATLYDVNHTNIGVTISFAGTWYDTSVMTGNGWGTGGGVPAWLDPNASKDYFCDTPSGESLTIAGMNRSQEYVIELISSKYKPDQPYKTDGYYRINGANSDFGTAQFRSHTNGYVNHTVMTWTMSPDLSGNFQLVLSRGTKDDVAYVNAMRISWEEQLPVSEPAGLGLVGLAMLASRRRRA